MKKKLFFGIITTILCLALTISAFAIYIPCLTEDEPHDWSEWAVAETRADGGTVLNRTCAKCGHIETGYGSAGSDGVATTRDGFAVITSLIVPEAAPVANPTTGAAI